MQEVKVATRIDQIMQLLIQAIETNQWSHPAVHDYKKVKDELTVHVGIILRGNRIVMPTFLRSKTVQLAHACHQGSVKTKRLLRTSGSQELTTPFKTKYTTAYCVKLQHQELMHSPPEPLKMTPLPKAPWKQVARDFLGPFPTGEYLLVVIDEFSRFPEVEIFTTISARAVIPRLDAIFARQVIPENLKSDNGPPFQGQEFKDCA